MVTDAWVGGADLAGFVRREEEALLRAAVLVRADLRRAEQLVEDALVVVGRRWAQASDDDPGADARRLVYRSAVADAGRDGSRTGAEVVLSGRSGEGTWSEARHPAEERRRRDAVGHALARLTPRQRAVLSLLALDGATVAEAAGTLRVLPRTVRGDARAALVVLARELPGENLEDGRADGQPVRWLLQAAVADVPAPDLAESVARRAAEGRRSVRRRTVLVAGGVVGAGALGAVVVPRLLGRGDGAPPVGDSLLGTTRLDDVVVQLAPTPEDEVGLPLAPDRVELPVPDPVGPGEPGDVVSIPPAGVQ